MQPDIPDEIRTYNILVHGAERKGLTLPLRPLTDRNYTLTFETFATNRRYNDFDATIVFQGIFEEHEQRHNYEGTYLSHKFDANQLDRRQKELSLLLKDGGFVCFVLCERFLDGVNYRSTDLCKIWLNRESLYRNNYTRRATHVTAKMGEFSRFLDIYGAASTYFDIFNDNLDMRPLAVVNSALVGMTMWDNVFFVPSLIPENIPDRIEEYFSLLADALTSCRNRLLVEIPRWVDSFQFFDEAAAREQRIELSGELDRLNQRIQTIRRLKRILVFADDPLVEEVANALENGLGFAVKKQENHREDLVITDKDGQALAFVEIKGTNRGVKREHINQADSHRERAGLASDFPTLLIMNTNPRYARSIDEKDMEIAAEQIQHATKNHVLIVRTLDLIRLIDMLRKKAIENADVLAIFMTKSGWLRVREDKWEVLQG